ncbi:MAG TPA: hypothetical protein VGT41_01335 [Candidatus Babeliales bacterium]|nr:hypothetical protein [Candidatus Babeliales bacterium]
MVKKRVLYIIFLCSITVLHYVDAKKTHIKKTVIITGTNQQKSPAPTNTENISTAPITITIWIHGTTPSIAKLPINSIQQFFYTKQGIFDPRTLNPTTHRHQIGTTLTESPLFPAQHFYMFGWSGTLSFAARQKAAEQLYAELITLCDHYQKTYSTTPRVRLITHSHGGNVALNMATMTQRPTDPLAIDELILLACPVQDHTAQHINNPMFKQIYSLYSTKDFLQIIDPQQLYSPTKTSSFFSRRRFTPHQKIRQVKIQINKRSISHIEFILSRFVRMLPKVLSEIKTWASDAWDDPSTEHTLRISTHNQKKRKFQSENPSV